MKRLLAISIASAFIAIGAIPAVVTAWHKDPDTIIILDDVAIGEQNPSCRVVNLLIKDLGLESCLIQKTQDNNTKYIAVLSSSALF